MPLVSTFMVSLLSSYKSCISGAIGLMNSASTFDSNEDDDECIIIAGLGIWLGWSCRKLGVAAGRVLMED